MIKNARLTTSCSDKNNYMNNFNMLYTVVSTTSDLDIPKIDNGQC